VSIELPTVSMAAAYCCLDRHCVFSHSFILGRKIAQAVLPSINDLYLSVAARNTRNSHQPQDQQQSPSSASDDTEHLVQRIRELEALLNPDPATKRYHLVDSPSTGFGMTQTASSQTQSMDWAASPE